MGTNEQVLGAVKEWRKRTKRRAVVTALADGARGKPWIAHLAMHMSSGHPRGTLVIEQTHYDYDYPCVSADQLARGDVPQAWVPQAWVPGWHVRYIHHEHVLRIGCKRIDLSVAARAIKTVRAALAASRKVRTKHTDINGNVIAVSQDSVLLMDQRLDASNLDAVERVIEMAVEARDYANANKKRK